VLERWPLAGCDSSMGRVHGWRRLTPESRWRTWAYAPLLAEEIARGLGDLTFRVTADEPLGLGIFFNGNLGV
jgi:hypothetical protein